MSVKLRSKAIARGRQSLYLDIYHKGQRRTEFLGLYLEKDNKGGQNANVRALAKKICAQREVDLAHIRNGELPVSSRSVEQDFFAFAETVIATKGESTQSAYRISMKHMRIYHGPELGLHQIDETWVVGWRAYLLKTLAHNTAWHHFTFTRMIVKEALKKRIIREDPFVHVDAIKQRKETERNFLTHEELAQLAATPCPLEVVKRAFFFAYFTGMRVSDVQALRWDRIHQDRISFRQRKTSSLEYRKLHDIAVQMLGQPDKPDTPAFDLPRYNWQINAAIKQWAATAGITKRVTFHVSRHTHATLMLANGEDITTVQKSLGHADVNTTMIYAKVLNATLDKATKALPSIPMIETETSVADRPV